MLIEFKCKDLSSSKEEFDFSMKPEAPVTVVCGISIAGKTSIINAMSCLRQIILKGNIENLENDKPVGFDITFICHSIKYRYVLDTSFEELMDGSVKRYIENENLYIDDKLMFCRMIENTESSIGDTDLMLVDTKLFSNKGAVKDINEWFSKKFIVINSVDRKQFMSSMLFKEQDPFLVDEMDKVGLEAGIMEVKTLGIDAEQLNLANKLRFVSIIPTIIESLTKGYTFVMEELDVTLRCEMLKNLIGFFNNKSVNKNNAQLIFSAKDSEYLKID